MCAWDKPRTIGVCGGSTPSGEGQGAHLHEEFWDAKLCCMDDPGDSSAPKLPVAPPDDPPRAKPLDRKRAVWLAAPATLGEFMRQHLAMLKLTESPSYRQYELRWRIYGEPFLADLTWRELTPHVMQQWMLHLRSMTVQRGAQNQALSPAWQRGILDALSACIGNAVTHGHLPYNPCKAARRYLPREQTISHKLHSHTIAEMRHLLSHPTLAPHERAEYAFAFYVGTRLGELRALRWMDLVLEEKPAYVRIERQFTSNEIRKPKGRKLRSAPLHSELIPILKTWRDVYPAWVKRDGPRPDDLLFPGRDGQIMKGHAHERFDVVLERVRLPRGTYHSLRHSMSSAYREVGVSIDDIDAITGHAPMTSRRMGNHYARARLSRLAEEIEKLRLFHDVSGRPLDRSGCVVADLPKDEHHTHDERQEPGRTRG